MKKHLLIIILLCSMFAAQAQTQTTVTRKVSLDETTVVKDSAGMVYPYMVWKKLMTTGNYAIRPVNYRDEKTEYIITEQSAAQKNALMSRMPKPADSKFFTTGMAIKPFKIKDMNGKKLDAKDWAGKTIVLNFWFIGCPPCRQEIPELNKIAANYANNPNVVFIGIALDQAYEIEQFIKTSPFNYRLVDDGRFYANQFKITLYPTNVVIDRSGKVQFHSSGYALNTPYWIDKTIQASEAEHAQVQ